MRSVQPILEIRRQPWYNGRDNGRTGGQGGRHMNDMEQLREFHQAHYDMLLRLARNRLRQAGCMACDAPHIVQEAFMLAAAEDVLSRPDALAWFIHAVDVLSQPRQLTDLTPGDA